MKALYIASSGMMAQEANVEVISNNIANLRTTGYKRRRVNFQDLLYQDLRRVGSSTSDSGTIVPAGIEIGSGVRMASTPRIMSQGSIQSTEKQYDLAIQGEGFFQIAMPDGRTGYTRDGSFELDDTGMIVTADGYPVEPRIVVPSNAQGFTISPVGEVQVVIGRASGVVSLGQINLARFINPAGLQSVGDNLYVETPASGNAQAGTPRSLGFGSLLQGHLESSNVNSVVEISGLITAQRAYEMNRRVISSADEMMSSLVQGR